MSGDATFQVLEALGRNRRKRRQRGEFLIHGVNAIDSVLRHDWPMAHVLARRGSRRSKWAQGVLDRTPADTHLDLPADLFDRLADRDEPGEIVVVARIREQHLEHITGHGPLLVLDRPASPGNLGTLIRSADAFGAAGVVILGHAADPYDPRTVRASVGSLFALPVVELGGSDALAPWLAASGRWVLGLDEAASMTIAHSGQHQPLALVLGTESRGLSQAARRLCNDVVSIPMQSGTASSLNVAVAGSIALYEVTHAR